MPGLERRRHLGEPRGLRLLGGRGRGCRRRGRNGIHLARREPGRLRELELLRLGLLLLGLRLRLMLLRLLLELVLILRRDRRHRGSVRETLRPGAATETRVLVLQRHRGLLLLLLLR